VKLFKLRNIHDGGLHTETRPVLWFLGVRDCSHSFTVKVRDLIFMPIAKNLY